MALRRSRNSRVAHTVLPHTGHLHHQAFPSQQRQSVSSRVIRYFFKSVGNLRLPHVETVARVMATLGPDSRANCCCVQFCSFSVLLMRKATFLDSNPKVFW